MHTAKGEPAGRAYDCVWHVAATQVADPPLGRTRAPPEGRQEGLNDQGEGGAGGAGGSAGGALAVVGLTAEGAAALHELVERMTARIEALRAWSQAD